MRRLGMIARRSDSDSVKGLWLGRPATLRLAPLASRIIIGLLGERRRHLDDTLEALRRCERYAAAPVPSAARHSSVGLIRGRVKRRAWMAARGVRRLLRLLPLARFWMAAAAIRSPPALGARYRAAAA